MAMHVHRGRCRQRYVVLIVTCQQGQHSWSALCCKWMLDHWLVRCLRIAAGGYVAVMVRTAQHSLLFTLVLTG